MLRFGIICGGTTLAAWQMQTIDHLRATDDMLATLLIIDEQGSSSRQEEPALWRWCSSLFLTRRASLSKPASVAARLSGIPILRTVREHSGHIRDEDVAAIRAYDLDFILDFGMVAATGALAQASRYGVWSFAGDGSEREGHSPPCFWAVYAGTPTVGVTLQRASGDHDAPTVLRQGDFRNFTHSYLRTLAHVQMGVTRWPAQVCRDIQRGVPHHMSRVPTVPPASRTAPTNLQVVAFLLRLAWRLACTVWVILFRHDQWNIGIVAAPIETFLVAGARPPVRWLPKPKRNHFLADPFPTADGALLVEEFDYRTRKGVISALTMAHDGAYSAPHTVIELPVHLSYPYLIHHQGDVYCVPETGEAGEISLYKATAFPNEWTKCMTLIEGFAGLDATIFPHDGRWWLLCTEQGAFSNTMLHAWHAPDLFGPWERHPGNPLKVDVRSSRPAGQPFIYNGQLYRPAQDCSRTYGGAVVINRVVHLSPTTFEEERVAIVEPYADSPYRHGLHTLSTCGHATVIDGKGRAFAPAELRRIIGVGLRRVVRRVFRKR